MPLFVHVSQNRLKALNDWHLYQDFSAIAATSERLASLHICPTMIRPTVLLSMQLRHPNSIEAVQMFAQHKSDTTTMGYVAKLPFRMILEQRMRKFSDTIEVVISMNAHGRRWGAPSRTGRRPSRAHAARASAYGAKTRKPGRNQTFPRGPPATR